MGVQAVNLRRIFFSNINTFNWFRLSIDSLRIKNLIKISVEHKTISLTFYQQRYES